VMQWLVLVTRAGATQGLGADDRSKQQLEAPGLCEIKRL
jgi:hypothetical protein